MLKCARDIEVGDIIWISFLDYGFASFDVIDKEVEGDFIFLFLVGDDFNEQLTFHCNDFIECS